MADRTIARELARTYALDRDLPCPRCRYNLRGLSGGRCPECGANVSGYIKKAALGAGRHRTVHVQDVRDRLLAWLGPTLAVMLATGFWLGVRLTGAPQLIERATAAAMALLVVLAADVWWQLVRRLWRRKRRVDRLLRILACWGPGVVAAAAVITLVG